MALEIKRLHLARLKAPRAEDGQWPVHGFVVTDGSAAVLVDTGVGGPQAVLDDWRVVNVAAADALAAVDLSPADISLVINTHLHFDHCGQNAVFRHAPFYVQRTELDRARRESPDLAGWFDFAGARFELLDGDAEILPGLSVVATPGHTAGHQCVVVTTGDGTSEVLIGDAAYTPREYSGPPDQELPPGQAADRPSWAASVGRLRSLRASRVHFCHDTDVIGG
jgi:N-acyl homoserine lactone hydrolase